ncbi:hypothetical protein FACS1894122_13560 [Alphaproteobacteria bacterium]|nr:hypothetical protein FACS1894122_13560 [Alphaproteobacteria bacterium]
MDKIKNNEKDMSVIKQVLSLQDKKTIELKVLWDKMFDHQPAISSREYMISKLAYRIQELTYGGVDEATQKKIQDAAKKSRVRRIRRAENSIRWLVQKS